MKEIIRVLSNLDGSPVDEGLLDEDEEMRDEDRAPSRPPPGLWDDPPDLPD